MIDLAVGDRYRVALLDNDEVSETQVAIIEIGRISSAHIMFYATGNTVVDPHEPRSMSIQVFANWIDVTMMKGTTQKL